MSKIMQGKIIGDTICRAAHAALRHSPAGIGAAFAAAVRSSCSRRASFRAGDKVCPKRQSLSQETKFVPSASGLQETKFVPNACSRGYFMKPAPQKGSFSLIGRGNRPHKGLILRCNAKFVSISQIGQL